MLDRPYLITQTNPINRGEGFTVTLPATNGYEAVSFAVSGDYRDALDAAEARYRRRLGKPAAKAAPVAKPMAAKPKPSARAVLAEAQRQVAESERILAELRGERGAPAPAGISDAGRAHHCAVMDRKMGIAPRGPRAVVHAGATTYVGVRTGGLPVPAARSRGNRGPSGSPAPAAAAPPVSRGSDTSGAGSEMDRILSKYVNQRGPRMCVRSGAIQYIGVKGGQL